MKNSTLIIILSILITGCSQSQKQPASTSASLSFTEVPCPGVEPKGLSIGMLAYFSITGIQWSAPIYEKPTTDSTSKGNLFHHIRVELEEGPVCAQNSAWWQVTTPDGVKGWVQIGSTLKNEWGEYSSALLPYRGDAVQQEVPNEQKLAAQVRYILADIELGGEDILKYYQDLTVSKPDDPELDAARIALEISNEWGKDQILANPTAFERKPLRGGTSVVDAGTEFVQPGLDILLQPCDGLTTRVKACKKISH